MLHDMRFTEDGSEIRGFPLNRAAFRNAQIVVARWNFGAGSSREAAVYALVDYSIRCVIAPSFGDVFASNSVNNGLLPARVDERHVENLIRYLKEGGKVLRVDLEHQAIAAGEAMVPFVNDPVWRMKLLNGWDDIDLTLNQADAIARFTVEDARKPPWAVPRVLSDKTPVHSGQQPAQGSWRPHSA